MTRLLFGAAALCILCSTTAAVQQNETLGLKLVSTYWPPFTNPSGQPRFALDLVEEALRRVGVTTTTSFVAAPEFTSSLLSGQFDGSAAIWKDAERDRVLLFSQPYLENRLVLVGRTGADVSATSLDELSGRRIAIVAGYAYGDAVDRPGPIFVRTRGEEDSLAQLLTGAVDFMLMDELVIHYLVQHYPEESRTRLQVGKTPLVLRELYLAVARARADAATIIDKFNAQLRGMLADRTYHRLLHVDWIRGDVDGDGVPEYVPVADRIGPTEPQRVYTLFTAPESKPVAPAQSGFYLGGTIYSDWASVPESFKEVNPDFPDPRRSTASVFSFSW